MLEKQKQIYGVCLPVHVAQRARVVAAMNGKSRSSLMRDLLLDYLKRCDNEEKEQPAYFLADKSQTAKASGN
jgi:metal-responsive CopG/Arc/MetJ family transcriptional regulator